MVDLYDAEILQWDHAFEGFRSFLEGEGWLENSIVIVTSDHGESFYDHRLWGHGNSLFNEVIRVPLVIRMPRNAKAAVVSHPVSNSRLAQFLKAFTETSPENRSALDLATVLTHGEGRVIAQTSKDSSRSRGAAVLDGSRKVIVIGSGEAEERMHFDLDENPGELDQRIGGEDEALFTFAATQLPGLLDQSPRVEIDESRRALLESLGYVE
jgi:arylsulfatase A-like enzyme